MSTLGQLKVALSKCKDKEEEARLHVAMGSLYYDSLAKKVLIFMMCHISVMFYQDERYLNNIWLFVYTGGSGGIR